MCVCVQAYGDEHSVTRPRRIIDMGCSTGISTRHLAEEYPLAKVTGLDLSPHFLALAEWEERCVCILWTERGDCVRVCVSM